MQTEVNKFIAIVIVNYKNEEKTIQYVKNELSKISVSFILIVVNNSANIDSNKKLISELSATLVLDVNLPVAQTNNYIISQDENLGFAKANNLGANFVIKHFETKYILFSNNDIRIIDNKVIDVLIERINSHQDIGMIGPNCLDINDISQSPAPFLPFNTRWIKAFWLVPFLNKQNKVKLLQLNYAPNAKEGYHYKISGSFFLVRLKDFINCGMMDSNTFLYCEEEILTERMYSIGKQVYYIPEVTVVHEHNQTIGKYINFKKNKIIEFNSSMYYYRSYKKTPLLCIIMGYISFYSYLYLKLALLKYNIHLKNKNAD